MPLIFYISHDGNQFEADLPVGNTVMRGAVDNGIDGIVGECGGACTCGTCHCYVDSEWLPKLDPPGEFETDLLEVVLDPQDNSRLGCQIKISEELNGLVVHLPKAQI